MPTEPTSQESQPSSPSPPSHSPWVSLAASLPGTVTATAAIVVVGRPIGQALPELISLVAKGGPWQPVAAALLALGLLVAPVPTLGLVKSLVTRLPLLGPKKP